LPALPSFYWRFALYAGGIWFACRVSFAVSRDRIAFSVCGRTPSGVGR
jgi:hypothetical protein